MAPNSSNSWDHTGLKVKRETCTPETDYNGMMDASQHFLHPTSSFTDPYHVSPITSPETSNRLMLPQTQELMGYHWAAAAPFLDHSTTFSTGQDWQTLTQSFEPNGLPSYDYTYMMPMPMGSVEFGAQAPPPAGSFSSTSSFDNSFNSGFPVQDTWLPNDMAYQYTLRPRLQLPEASERDMSLEGTISPRMTRLIPTPSFQSNPPSPSSTFARRPSGSSSPSDGMGSNDHSMTTISSSSSRSHDHHHRTRLPSPKASSRRLLPAASSSSAKSQRPSLPATTVTSSSPSSSKPATKHSKGPKSSQPAEPSSEQPSGPDSRAAKDEFLLKAKAKGMTYKEIRRKGNFSEAESTLRGRYRTLTKPKDLRVRKPEWSENDLRLLEQGVRRTLMRGQSLTTAKIPWREVADYIYQNGGSYLFGLSTCRKRWDELVLAETARGKDIGRAFYEQ